MNANIVKMHLFQKIKRSFKVTNNDLFDQKFAFSSVYVIDWLKKQMPLNIMKEQSLTYTKTTFALFNKLLAFSSHVPPYF